MKSVPTYEIVYGTLAALPLFLIWIYLCWLIVLSGAAITATLTLDADAPRHRPAVAAQRGHRADATERSPQALITERIRQHAVRNRVVACRIPSATLHCGQFFAPEHSNVWSIVQAAGWPIWPLIFASVIALALIFERLWSLRQSVVAPPAWCDRVLAEYRANGATPEFIGRIAQQGPLGRILATGLANVKSPRPVIKEAIEEVGRVVTHDLERFLTTLGTIAAMSPLLGLFGTVVGMIEIFGSQTRGRLQPAPARARHFRRAVQHRVRADRGDSRA